MEEQISAMIEGAPITVDMDDSMQQVERVMLDNAVSAVPVVDRSAAAGEGLVVGIISARDLVRPAAEKRDPATLQAWELCSYKPVEVGLETPVADVARLMLERGIHHVVVTDKGEVAGMVSALDFVKRFLREREA